MRRERRKDHRQELYYFTHLANLKSILEHGILSRDIVEERRLRHKEIANKQIIQNRKEKGLTRYVPLYICPRNAMLYSKISMSNWRIVILGIAARVLRRTGVLISIGNAASNWSELVKPERIHIVKLFEEIRNIRDWRSEEATIPIQHFYKNSEEWRSVQYLFPKTFLQSEVLVPDRVPPDYICAIYVPNSSLQAIVRNEINELFNAMRIEVIVNPDLFFLPVRRKQIYDNLYIVHGDMFDSQLQTLTISVNTVGVMGRGLASRIRYMYPSAYIVYQQLTRKKIIKPGIPFLYKPETRNEERWFLFFPTKRHWKEKSDPSMIEEGLKRFIRNYKNEGVKSIAFPALGCGLGGLEWKNIGPMMVSYLKELDIPVEVYIPMDDPRDEYFTREFYETRDDYF